MIQDRPAKASHLRVSEYSSSIYVDYNLSAWQAQAQKQSQAHKQKILAHMEHI